MSTRHFLSLDDLGTANIEAVIQHAIDRKRNASLTDRPLLGRSLAMVFEKASTRTRVSFEAAMTRLGGHAIFLSPGDTQIGRGEPVADTARVLSGMCDAIMIRNHSHDMLETFAAHARVPVINGLTDRLHPCQLLADLQTYVEHRGSIRGASVAWIGDGNNMCNSYINAARLMGFSLRIAAPEGYRPENAILEGARDAVTVCDKPQEAVDGAQLVVTDVWASMGDEADRETRLADFANYQVNRALMSWAADDALFMHCLPAHRGEEVSAEVIDGPQSVVWDEAENRLHAQTALLLDLLTSD